MAVCVALLVPVKWIKGRPGGGNGTQETQEGGLGVSSHFQAAQCVWCVLSRHICQSAEAVCLWECRNRLSESGYRVVDTGC